MSSNALQQAITAMENASAVVESLSDEENSDVQELFVDGALAFLAPPCPLTPSSQHPPPSSQDPQHPPPPPSHPTSSQHPQSQYPMSSPQDPQYPSPQHPSPQHPPSQYPPPSPSHPTAPQDSQYLSPQHPTLQDPPSQYPPPSPSHPTAPQPTSQYPPPSSHYPTPPSQQSPQSPPTPTPTLIPTPTPIRTTSTSTPTPTPTPPSEQPPTKEYLDKPLAYFFYINYAVMIVLTIFLSATHPGEENQRKTPEEERQLYELNEFKRWLLYSYFYAGTISILYGFLMIAFLRFNPKLILQFAVFMNGIFFGLLFCLYSVTLGVLIGCVFLLGMFVFLQTSSLSSSFKILCICTECFHDYPRLYLLAIGALGSTNLFLYFFAFAEFHAKAYSYLSAIYIAFCGYWFPSVITNVIHVSVCAVFVRWYQERGDLPPLGEREIEMSQIEMLDGRDDGDQAQNSPAVLSDDVEQPFTHKQIVQNALWEALTVKFGSICLSSLPIATTVSSCYLYFDKRQCCMSLYEIYAYLVRHHALTYVAICHKEYSVASHKVMALFNNTGLQGHINFDKLYILLTMLFFPGKFIILLVTLLFCPIEDPIYLLFVILFSWIICYYTFGLITTGLYSSVTAFYLSYALDPKPLESIDFSFSLLFKQILEEERKERIIESDDRDYFEENSFIKEERGKERGDDDGGVVIEEGFIEDGDIFVVDEDGESTIVGKLYCD